MEQFYFRFIRLDSKEQKDVHYVTYKDSVEQNLMALVLTKERLNEFIKTGEVKEQSEIFEEFDVTMSVIEPAGKGVRQRRQDTHQLGKPAHNELKRKTNRETADSIPQAKVAHPYRQGKVRPQAVSGNHPRRGSGISPKTLRCRGADLWSLWNEIPGSNH